MIKYNFKIFRLEKKISKDENKNKFISQIN